MIGHIISDHRNIERFGGGGVAAVCDAGDTRRVVPAVASARLGV